MRIPEPLKDSPSVSIIIPSFNGSERLRRLLPTLAPISGKHTKVIVVVDGSDDGSLELIKRDFPSIAPIWRTNGGRAAARNSGAQATNSELIIFLDDDCIPEAQFINEHRKHHEKHPNTIATGPAFSPLGTNTEFEQYRRAKSFESHNSLLHLEDITHLQFLSAANMSIPKILFEKLGGFNEALRDCEDYDLAIRAAKRSIAIYYLPNAVVAHDDRLTIGSYISRIASYRHNIFQLNKAINKETGRTTKIRSRLKNVIFTNILWHRIFELQILHQILPIAAWTKLYDAFIWEQAGRFALKEQQKTKSS